MPTKETLREGTSKQLPPRTDDTARPLPPPEDTKKIRVTFGPSHIFPTAKAISTAIRGQRVHPVYGKYIKNKPVQLQIHADEEQMSRMLELAEVFSLSGELDNFLNLAEDHAELRLMEFKRAVKSSGYSPAQYELVQTLNAIEKKVDDFPLVAPKQATKLLGMFASGNPSRDIGRLISEHKLFGFSFGESKVLQLPAFQFNATELKPWAPVSRLCELFSELNDWAVYDWMTTFNEDLGTTPADALTKPDLYDDLIDIAGLYRNENKHAHLHFSVKGDK